MRLLPIASAVTVLAACTVVTDNPNTSDAGSDAGDVLSCDPTVTPDTCATGGEACTPDYTGASSTGYDCQPPGPFFDCVPEIGCAAPNLMCIGADAGVPGSCLQTCNTSADCGDPLTICQPLAGDGGPQFCFINLCDDFWQPCPGQSGDGGDGTCVFFYVDPMYGPVGACLQAGPVPLNGTCTYYRDAGGEQCVAGTVCEVSGGTAPTGACMPACDSYADGGPACGGTCVPVFPPAPPPILSALDFGTQIGACASGCDANDNCPAPYSCDQYGTSGPVVCLP